MTGWRVHAWALMGNLRHEGIAAAGLDNDNKAPPTPASTSLRHPVHRSGVTASAAVMRLRMELPCAVVGVGGQRH